METATQNLVAPGIKLLEDEQILLNLKPKSITALYSNSRR